MFTPYSEWDQGPAVTNFGKSCASIWEAFGFEGPIGLQDRLLNNLEGVEYPEKWIVLPQSALSSLSFLSGVKANCLVGNIFHICTQVRCCSHCSGWLEEKITTNATWSFTSGLGTSYNLKICFWNISAYHKALHSVSVYFHLWSQANPLTQENRIQSKNSYMQAWTSSYWFCTQETHTIVSVFLHWRDLVRLDTYTAKVYQSHGSKLTCIRCHHSHQQRMEFRLYSVTLQIFNFLACGKDLASKTTSIVV